MVTYPSTTASTRSDRRRLRARPRRRRTGVRRRGQPQRAASGWRSPAGSAATSPTSTCTRRSASARRRRSGRRPGRGARSTWRRSCPAHPPRRRRRGYRARCRRPRTARPGILPIPWAYLALMGPTGCAGPPQSRSLAANYVADAARRPLPGALRRAPGRVAHECILDLRGITKATGVTVDDVAKRLIDYGFHAPTMSFPVAGTLMVEPTESETSPSSTASATHDRHPRRDRAGGGGGVAGERARCATPRTPPRLVADEWDHPYSPRARRLSTGAARGARPQVVAAGAAHRRRPGDRNLVCSCPAPEASASPGQDKGRAVPHPLRCRHPPAVTRQRRKTPP